MEETIRRIAQAHGVTWESLCSPFDAVQRECDVINRTVGTLDGIDCPLCRNRGFLAYKDDSYAVQRECECMKKRRSIWRIEKSGLKKQLEKCTFANYEAKEKWQEYIKDVSLEYVECADSWFFIGGQVGSGKSHICTAICGELIGKGKDLLYIVWIDEAVKLKANKMNDEEYQKMIHRLQTTEVLYIDDFFKVRNGEQPTNADVNIAFEILNYRYNNGLQTIISSEKKLADVTNIDEATGSRIFEKCVGKYRINLQKDGGKNYRTRNYI